MKVMKKNLLFVLLGIQGIVMAQNPVPNSGFENWTNNEPDSWLSNNIAGFTATTTQVSPGYSSLSAIKCEVGSIAPGVNYAPFLVSTDTNGNGFPVSQNYTNLSFYYKLNLTGTGEVFDVFVALTDLVGNGVAVGSQTFCANSSTTVFTQANIPLIYFGVNPAEASISFFISDTLSGTGVSIGSNFVIDDVSMNFASGIPTSENENGLQSLYPIPVKHNLNIPFKINRKQKIRIEIFDINGRKVQNVIEENFIPGSYKIETEISSLAEGTYICRMIGENINSTVKFMVVNTK